MTIDDVLNKLVQEPELKKYPHSYNPIIIARCKQALLEILLSEKPEYKAEDLGLGTCDEVAFWKKQGVEAYEQKIKKLFK